MLINTDRFLDDLGVIVGIPSHSGSKDLADFVCRRLQSAGVGARILSDANSSVLATFDGPGEKEILIYSHLDTCSPQGDALPLVPRRRNGRFYGLGVSDDKASVALMLQLAGILKGRKLRHKVQMLFSGREEGVAFEENSVSLLLAKKEIQPTYGIILEPTCDEERGLGICLGCYGLMRINLNFKGRQGHSALPEEAINPIPAASSFINGFYLKFQPERKHTLKIPGLDFAMEAWVKAAITQVQAVEGLGTIPGNCLVSCEWRIPPGGGLEPGLRGDIAADLDSLVGETKMLFPEVKISHSKVSDYPGYLSTKSGFVEQLFGCAGNEVAVNVIIAPGRCDANVLEAQGVPCVVIGPGLMKECHKREEYLVESLAVNSAELIARNVVLLCSA